MKKTISKGLIYMSTLLLVIPISSDTAYAYSGKKLNHYQSTEKNNDKEIDFKDDKEKAKEWGSKEAKEWKLTFTEKEKVNDFLNDKNGIQKNYNNIIFSMDGKYPNEKNDFKKIEKMFEKANFSKSVVTYKNIESTKIGFNKSLTDATRLNSESYQELKKQFLDKDIKFDNYLDMHLTQQNASNQERVILKVTVPNGRGSATPTRAGVVLNDNEYKMLIDKGYLLHVDKISKVVNKGLECVQI